MESLKEINRVLQPHGAFGAVWNIEDCRSNDLPSQSYYPWPWRAGYARGVV